jgi:ArsR family transcriptional regulator, arsenate/arsenite/antimonite-responsive transcriptional repressor
MEEQITTNGDSDKPQVVQDPMEIVQPLIALASALLDTDRLRIAGLLAAGPASRMELAEATGLSHRDLLRQLDMLQEFKIVQLEEPAPRNPDQYSRYELNHNTFRSARLAMGKYKGVKPRPTDSRLMTLETFMPGGKLNAFPKKQEQILTILNEIAGKFSPDRQYAEREVDVILEEVNEDYCTIRRYLVEYGYLSRSGGVYTRNA